MSTEQQLSATGPAEKPGFFRRHRRGLRITLALVLLIPLIAVGLAWFFADRKLSQITRVEIPIEAPDRPQQASGDTFLLLGSDSGSDRGSVSIIEAAKQPSWPQGLRSDTMLVVHVPDNRKKAYVISIPRDSYVPIFDGAGEQHGKAKINAALSLYGPGAAVVTVEKFLNVGIEHVAMTDWDGFVRTTDALGGVKLSVDGAAPTRLSGDEALDYVRVRKSLPNGDFDRVKRQHAYLRAMGQQIVSRGTLTNPRKTLDVVNTLTQNLAVDDEWSNSEIRNFALAMRGIRPANIDFLTIPHKGTARDPVAGSIVVVDKQAARDLSQAIRTNTMDAWVDRHRDEVTGALVN